ncbi:MULTISPECIES: PBECR2 nuclease fold domain-containing protein [unclassified Pseudomonas]|uniref:PBECR2 nuclease fold domain-containing protein n=1 Tax=unclassified Pseudomonas TaxID=196821 RepID=UPI001CC0FAC8|nr:MULTISPECIES: PBECR2 nuclease fold domain-containing protein [unclassified Pseudomonas]
MTIQQAEIAVVTVRDHRMKVPGVKEAPDQESWKDLGLPDLRDISIPLETKVVRELPGAVDVCSALRQVALGFGLHEGTDTVLIETPYLPVTVRREHLRHIVEKRPNARERFTEFAVDTLNNPLEIWRVSYSDGSYRLAFIGAYHTKYQMLVVIHVDRGYVLWNFMNCDKKALNKHRHGGLVYQRYLLSKQKKQPE